MSAVRKTGKKSGCVICRRPAHYHISECTDAIEGGWRIASKKEEKIMGIRFTDKVILNIDAVKCAKQLCDMFREQIKNGHKRKKVSADIEGLDEELRELKKRVVKLEEVISANKITVNFAKHRSSKGVGPMIVVHMREEKRKIIYQELSGWTHGTIESAPEKVRVEYIERAKKCLVKNNKDYCWVFGSNAVS